jgi:hypothetical protein
MARSNDYISAVRTLNKQIWDGIHALKAAQAEWLALDYTNTLEDGTGANEGYTSEEIGAVVNTTADALIALLAEGHGTNMSKLL